MEPERESNILCGGRGGSNFFCEARGVMISAKPEGATYTAKQREGVMSSADQELRTTSKVEPNGIVTSSA